ncbi:phenylalanine--tRNA ligase subunit alpha [endosymbiont GvMRE of Glomus versiforme]|uniref:phenylalanine--tRNA ligase subunit alpha n=1 Tax=endosymbiont GvMRE of Glomus versiforme TaxID=2039283 RepID=UPI000EDF92BE|nr:phenylalanine--tRNA ligase subunit alpha [endosymbiont GvMRE of Glomus versiforme]RHZ35203.1 Phenylalanine--tRNA ligase alpha subunit [endosymbiont GvMRE of Glomus versiforme]
MKNRLTKKNIVSLAEKSLKEVKNSQWVENVKKEYLGKEGVITHFFKIISREKKIKKKKEIGILLNEWKKKLVEKIISIEKKLKKKYQIEGIKSSIDIYLEGKKNPLGNFHPLTQIIQDIYDIFLPLGYRIVKGPEVETEENNFTLLNMPSGHPARDMQDTFYLKNNFLLRTQTTAIQPRLMKKNPNTELKIISIGKVYRRDEDDSTHTHQFTQFDCFVVGKDISFNYLKKTLEWLVRKLFNRNQIIRFRPSYFPFTEPSIEVDSLCSLCRGKGCGTCKKTGWIEIAGAGLIHPSVLKNCSFNSRKFTGFAFAFGLERILMLKYGIEDIRHFYTNDARFLHQFRMNN